jgi:hypothetical protein
MRHVFRAFASFLVAICVTLPSSAFDVPLSDEAVREAYFLGQRHDASFLTNYIKFLPLPKTGPHISSITFLTPFARFAQFSGNYVGNYSAQQALLDHRGEEETVKITVEVYLTNSYGALIPLRPVRDPDHHLLSNRGLMISGKTFASRCTAVASFFLPPT